MCWIVKLPLAALAAGWLMGGASPSRRPRKKARMRSSRHGCWQCHGFAGQGGVAGLKLAPDPMPLESLSTFIRSSNGPMPPYSEKVISNDDVADIHAYLASIPKPPDYKTIPLLSQ